MIEKIDGMTKDLVKENIEKLKELFPTIVKEDKIDFEELQLLLGEDINNNKEQYSFVWNGKTEATKLAQKRSTGTLRPCIEESKNWDTTKNIYIEGDNLEVLKLLQSSYNGRIKMIYIDPPYNTGHDFVYKDNFEDNIANYKEVTGQAQKSNVDTDGRYHTNWLNMMYPRLKLARNLLSDNGAIFISIDDNEQANVLKLCNEIFGEQNKVAEFVVIRAEGGGMAKQVIKGHEYLFVFAKDISKFSPLGKPKDIRGKIVEKDGEKYWIQEDWLRKEFGKYGNCHYEEVLECKGQEKLNEINEGLNSGKYVLIPKSNGMNVIGKLRNIKEDSSKFYSILKHLSANGIKDLEELGLNNYFSYPKPVSLISEIVAGATIFTLNDGEIILDFFSGSATIAHAVMQLNAEDGGNRKFICVQLPEKTNENSEAFKAGYENICEIGKERIRKAENVIKKKSIYKITFKNKESAEKYYEENLQSDIELSNDKITGYRFSRNVDYGFKVFKLDSSNLKKWNNSPTEDADEVAKRIQISMDYLENDRTELDLVYEIMLKYGIDLTLPITKTANEKAYIVNGEEYKLLICSQMNLKLEDIEEFANESVGTYLFADRCFSDDNLLINAQEILKAKNKEMRLF